MPIYAQLDDNGICMAMVDTSGPLAEGDKIIAVGGYDISVLGKKYEKGEWLEAPAPASPASQVEVLSAQVGLLLNAAIKSGSITADMVQAANLPETDKAELAAKLEVAVDADAVKL